jgi:sugar/nucleoside kinase (ribokinase family)
MSAAGVVAALAFDPDHGTGRAMITYLPGDIRFMVSDRGANAAFDQCDLTGAMLEAAATARLLYVSGYSLIEPARRAAVGRLIDAARTGGATVALDVVPHEFDAFMPRAAIEDLLAAVDWILLEVPTGRRLAGLPPGATLDDVLAALLDHTPSVALFPHPSRAVIGHRGARCERSFDYTPGAASRGQSARAQAELLFEFLGAVGGP